MPDTAAHRDDGHGDGVDDQPVDDLLVSTVPPQEQSTHYVPPRVMTEPAVRRTRYAALSVLLARRRGLTASVPMERIDEIVGNLPQSAYRYRSWWANTMTSPQGRAWAIVDWKVIGVDLADGSISFGRDPMPEPTPTTTGYQPHWLQLKVASKAVESWIPGKVSARSGEMIAVRHPTCTATYWCRFFATTDESLRGSRVWVNTRHQIVAVPQVDHTAVFSVRTMSVDRTGDAIPPQNLHPGERPPGFGLTMQEFSDLTEKDQRRALTLIGEEIAWMLDTTGEAHLRDAAWSVGEYHFGGNGNQWINSWEIRDRLSDLAEPLVYFSSGELGLEYSEQTSLLELGPGLCFFVFEPQEFTDWSFEERVDRNDLDRIRKLAREGYYHGATGWKDPNFDPPGLSVYPPLTYEDILGDEPADAGID